MRIAIQADDGDEVAISADFLSVEQATVTLEIENALYSEISEFDSVTLSIDKARELANALLAVTEAIESVSKPAAELISLPRQTKIALAAVAG
jgi:sulfite reductase beta subunit-like hemoprotein